ncbi:MAG: penicillin acylase family protein [Promethearchaeota archaeon]
MLLSSIPTVAIICLFSISLFNIIPPIGSLIQPRGGIFDHADDGIFPDVQTVRDPELLHNVTVYRDEYGVPHFYASSIDDLYFAVGYTMALDRLWEMDILSRLAAGRLAEVISVPTIPGLNMDPKTIAMIDAYFRIVCLKDAANNLVNNIDALGKDAIEYRMTVRYIDGINHAIDDMKRSGDLPLEFTLLNYKPEHWTKFKTALIGVLVQYMLSLSTKDLERTSLAETIGSFIDNNTSKYSGEDFGVLFPEANSSLPYEKPVIPDNNSIFKSMNVINGVSPVLSRVNTMKFLTSVIKSIHEILGFKLEQNMVPASNNWVVDGNRTRSGKPILCGDPHLIISQPAIFYEMHVSNNGSIKLNCHGVTFPGLPVILIGFNDKVAWSLTSFGSDTTTDFYYETMNDTHYLFNGSWHELEMQEENIKIRNHADYKFTIRKTIHGPIISDIGNFKDLWASLQNSTSTSFEPLNSSDDSVKTNISMRWTALEKTDKNILKCMFTLNKAQNLSDFMNGLEDWTAPPQNLVYADNEGNIAMFIPGLLPVRAKNGDINPLKYTGSFVQQGDGTGEEWVGFIPFEQMPRSINPSQSYLASANQRSIAAENYNYSLGVSWGMNYRARRINDLLSNSWNLTREDMIAYQADIHDVAAERFLPPLLNILKDENLTGDLALAYQLLLSWNNSLTAYEMQKELIAPTIFDFYFRFLADETWADEWNASGALGLEYPQYQYLEYMVREDLNSPWFDDISTTDKNENGSTIMFRAFSRAMSHVSSHVGNLTSGSIKWIWGRVHKLLPASLLNIAQQLLLKRDVAIPYDGSSRTLRNAQGFGEFPSLVAGGPSWRQIIDFSRLNQPLTVLPMGNSGHVTSPHWSDQLPLYVNNQYKKPSRAANVENFLSINIESTLYFIPSRG